MIKFTREIALITAVSDLRMFFDNVKGLTAGFLRIDSRSAGEKSPSGPIKIHKDLLSFKSSAFRISGLQSQVYISDIPNTNRIDGSLFLFTLPSPTSTTPTIVRRNVGIINYEKGVITINPINILSGKVKDGQTIIELSACPVSNDVIGLQDLYLQLDISTSNFETVVDEVSSGLDPAASNYIVTSSYANGNLVRS